MTSPRLVHLLAEHAGGLQLLYTLLDEFVTTLGLQDAAVVLEQPPFGHQLFRAGRRPGEDDGLLATMPIGCYTTPPLDDPSVEAAVLDACRVALRLPWESESVPGPHELEERFDDTLSHARRSGCAFTFALVAFARAGGVEEFAKRLARTLRRDDGVFRLGPAKLALVLPVAAGEDVGAALERASAGDRGCPAFTYSVVACPAEAADLDRALELARERLAAVNQSLAREPAKA
ncbi:MAG: hypothetical protein ACT4OX_05700 [Actinomycetota bacterium]